MGTSLGIALVAHEKKKTKLLRWVDDNRDVLAPHRLYATGTVGTLLEWELHLPVTRVGPSGRAGGDVQLAAKIVEGEVDVLVLFWDPWDRPPHDPELATLLRTGTARNVPMACNLATAEALVRSDLLRRPG
jgi:methylglyoxal synthase